METLILSISIAVCVSFLCSFAEAALYAVSEASVRMMKDSGSLSGKILFRLKEKMDKPISAILITNTVANTMMASVAGAAAFGLWGKSGTFYMSIIFTLLILFLGEIIPKVLGVAYHKSATQLYVFPLFVGTKILFPLIKVGEIITFLIRRKKKESQASEAEILSLAKIGAEEGSILPIERQIIVHALKLDEMDAKDIMTPRTVLISVDGNKAVKDVRDESIAWRYSRIPVYDQEADNITGVVMARDVVNALIKENDLEKPVRDLAKPLHFVPEMMSGDKLLAEFLVKKSHLFGVVDEYGEVLGVVTLEDVLETLIGTEILDETDLVADLQELARTKFKKQVVERKHQNNTGSSEKVRRS